jgi:zinc protease
MAASKLAVSFELEADRMRHLNILPEELKKELEVVTEERRMRTEDNPQAKMAEQFAAMAYTSSPYKNPIIGWPSDIAAYTAPDLQAWYQRWYAPNNATLVVVGDVNTRDVFELAQQYFGELQPSDIVPLKPQVEMPQQGVRKMTMKVPAKLPSVVLAYHVPTLKTAKDESEAYALEVLAGVLDGGNSARLSATLIRGKQIAVAASAGYNMGSRLDDLFELEGTPAEGKTVLDVEAALKHEIAQLQAKLIEPAELDRIKAQVLAGQVYQRDSNFYQAMQLGMMETIGLGWQKSGEYVSKINQVTAEQVRAVAQKYLIEDHLNIAYLEPQKINVSQK